MRRLRFWNLAADEKGAAIIELALCAPMLAVMAIGVVDMSNAFSRKLALEQGAQRSIEKVMQTTGDSTVADTIKDEVVCQVNGTKADGTCKSSPITTNDVTVTYRLECTSTSGTVTPQTETDADAFNDLVCGGSTDTEARYIEVKVVDKYTPIFPLHFASYNSSDSSYHLSATAGMRTQ